MAVKKNTTDLLDTLLESISSDSDNVVNSEKPAEVIVENVVPETIEETTETPAEVVTEEEAAEEVEVDDVVDDMEIEESEDLELQSYYDLLSSVYESTLKSVLKSFIYESEMSSDEKIAKLETLDELEITESHIEKFIEKYISPITEASRITQVENITEAVIVPLGAYQIASRLNEAFGSNDEDGDTLFESIFGKELQEDVKEQLNADIKELIENSGLEFETEEELREFIEAADEIRELVDTDVVIPDVFDVAESVLVHEYNKSNPNYAGSAFWNKKKAVKERLGAAATAAKSSIAGKASKVSKVIAGNKGKSAAAAAGVATVGTAAAVAYKKMKARKAAAVANESVVDPIEGTVAFLEAFIVEGETSTNAILEAFIKEIKSIK